MAGHHLVGLRALLAILTTALASMAYAQGARWSQPFPSPRYASTMVFDSARGRAFMFSGLGDGPQGETWECDGAAWTQRIVSGPPSRGRAAMAYDSDRAITVLYGGWRPSGSSLADTWEWNGVAWTQAQVTGPNARTDCAMAYDSARHVTVLFGGSIGPSRYDETWEWDGAAWTQRLVTGPSARYWHAMAYDASRHVTVLYGGFAGSNQSDTWEWDGSTWTQRAVTGPGTRVHHAMAYDADRARTILFGGSTLTDSWEWDGAVWVRSQVAAPPARDSPSMAYDTVHHQTLLFGGRAPNTSSLGDLWTWNGAAWTQVVPSPPDPGRYWHSMSFDAGRGVTVLYGGWNTSMSPASLGDTWEFNGQGWTQRNVPGPTAKHASCMVYDAARGVNVLFGGSGESGAPQFLAETWEWNGTAWTQRQVTGPPARDLHAMAYDSSRQVVVLFGGLAGSPLADTWEWNGAAWTQRLVSGPSARTNHAMAYDAARGVTVLFGGSVGGNETWEWDGTAWSLRADTGPPGRQSHSLAYDPVRHVTVLFGGTPTGSGIPIADLWEWDGLAWTQRPFDPAFGPTFRSAHKMVYDSARGAVVMFGNANVTRETWELRPCDLPTINTQPTPQIACAGSPIHLSIAATAPDAISYQWRRGSPAAPIPGATSANLTIPTAASSDAGTYDCDVTTSCGTVPSNPVLVVVNSSDFNNDGDSGTDQDIESFFTCLAGNCCAACGSADFNGDGDVGTDADIEAFFRVLAGGLC